ncbi:RloB domain-containing protein [Flavobacterium sp. D11R37]|uniref:RloB family protein n=1 Tax=Flavobacterium coralii TaxID=2838017 RepID=UPI001CA70D1A|nr:RloB family protein [Flavobacterium coralii]MBY8963276.1 RloB domain-containing protein [Flavobacterium coralii]
MSKKNKKASFSFSDFLSELKENSVSTPKNIEKFEERKYFLIVCEGERTEPAYFNYFKKLLPKQLLDTIQIQGEGDNTINIVNKAIQLKEERKLNILLPNYDEAWAIFDKDDFPSERYNEAVRLAGENDINSGHSNQSFELWYILHFEFLQSALHRSDYIKKLTNHLGFKYEKNDTRVVEYLFKNCNIERAIHWAKELDSLHEGTSVSNACPHTKVYELVEKLREYCEPV